MSSRYTPLNPRPKRTTWLHWAEYIMLAILVACIGAGLGRLWNYTQEYLLPWLAQRLSHS